MGQHTSIEWSDSTLNLQMGCLGCELWDRKKKVRTCYAGNLIERHKGQKGYPKSFEEPEIFPYRMAEAQRWRDLTGEARADKPWMFGLPRVIFLNDLGDTFTEGLPEDWLADFLEPLGALKAIVLVLTKRAKAARAFFDRHACPDNFRLGVSVTDWPTARARLPDLQAARVPGRFISAEPWLGPGGFPASTLHGIEWVILGGESAQPNPAGKPRSTHIDDLEDAVEQAQLAGAAVFVKQLGSAPVAAGSAQQWLIRMDDRKGGNMEEWPPHLRIRQMPPSFRPAPQGDGAAGQQPTMAM